MQCFRVTIKPLSAFATPLKGDSLFGQLCWAIRNRLGEGRLNGLLNGYTENRPFAVVSDVFPEGYLPLPKLPSGCFELPVGEDRKAVKKRQWLPESALQQPLADWLRWALTSKSLVENVFVEVSPSTRADTEASPSVRRGAFLAALSEKHPQPHNAIDRRTNTTGEGGFAPYSIEQEWFAPGVRWTLYLLLDTSRLSLEDCRQCLEDIGSFGYGKDASIGLGKFELQAVQAQSLPAQTNADACLTLAPCAPQSLGYDVERSYYQLFTRFGRHGDMAVHQQGKPFKNPVLLAQTASLFGIVPPQAGFIGQGIGGNGELSKTLTATVQQGYTPVIGIKFQP